MKNLSRLIFVGFAAILLSCGGAKQFTFVQMADPQLGFGGYAHDSVTLIEAVAEINALNPDFVIICGDIVNEMNEKSITDVKKILADLKPKLCLLPGNHDVANSPSDSTMALYHATFGDDYGSFEHNGVRFITVNTSLWKSPLEGHTDKMTQWFEAELRAAQAAGERIVVAGHAPLFLVSLDEEDAYDNFPKEIRNRIFGLMKDAGVEAYLSGHVHKSLSGVYDGIQMVCCEALSKNFDVDRVGYRLWTMSDEGMRTEFVEVVVP